MTCESSGTSIFLQTLLPENKANARPRFTKIPADFFCTEIEVTERLLVNGIKISFFRVSYRRCLFKN
jgi:hypothetical protein